MGVIRKFFRWVVGWNDLQSLALVLRDDAAFVKREIIRIGERQERVIEELQGQLEFEFPDEPRRCSALRGGAIPPPPPERRISPEEMDRRFPASPSYPSPMDIALGRVSGKQNGNPSSSSEPPPSQA